MTGRHVADHDPDPDAPSVVRSEERVTVRTEVVPTARAVLRVETVTEEILVPVTVTRQRVRVDVVPAAEDLPPTGTHPGRTRTGSTSAWVTLVDQEPVVTLRAVPSERVRLTTAWVEGEEQVSAQVSHDEVVIDGPTGT